MLMVDIFSKDKRHDIMSKIKGKDTKIEIKVRYWLFHKGIRYRKNCKNILGRPDIAIKKYKIAIFVHGCFWHGHENCKYYRIPKSNIEFWQSKIEKNRERDKKIIECLENEGWQVFVIWGCMLKEGFEGVMESLYEDIKNVQKHMDLS